MNFDKRWREPPLCENEPAVPVAVPVPDGVKYETTVEE